MKKLYTAVGRMQFKGRNQDMRCPMVLLNNKEYILDIQEMMIWSILNWRILSDDEIKTLYENKSRETGYMTHRSAAECMQRLVRRGLVAEGEGELGADALFDLLAGLYVVPISESPILRLISFIRLTVFEHIPYSVTKQIFRRDKRSSDEQKVMLLANQAILSTAEMIKCAELNTFAFGSEDELIDTLYHDEYTTSENISHSVRFPFLILYLALALCCGVIIMLGELALGRKTGHGAVGAYQSISKRFKWLGWLGIAAAALIFSFYSALGGYCLRYVVVNFGNLIGAEFGTNGVGGADVFQGLLSQPDVSIAFALAFMLITMLVVMSGVGGGIERVCSVGMPALFFILIICIIRSCTLPGAVDGLKYMFVPGWAVANGIIDEAPGFWRVLTAAGGQMFFSLSLGAGVMITYGSYLDKKQDLGKSAMIIVGMDTVVALMAGLCVIPGRFALDPNGALGGPELLFITMQNVFDKMGPAGPVFGILFYLLVFFAAISSSISMLEVIVAHFCDKAREKGKGDRRKLYSAIAVVICAALCALVCADGMGSNHISPAELLGLAGAKLPGWSTSWLGLFDSVAEGLLMPLGALLMCLMISWELKPDALRQEILLNGENRPWVYDFFRLCVKYITPLCMLMILYGQISDFFIA